MKRWAALTVLLYAITLALLTLPMVLSAFGGWGTHNGRGIVVEQTFAFYQERGYWVWVAIMSLGAALLLVVPVGVATERPVARRPLLVLVAVTSFFLANLFFGALLSVLGVTLRDQAFEFLAFTGELVRINPPEGSGLYDYLFGTLTVIAMLWLIWAMIFYRFAKSDNPDALVKRTTRWLLRGSILELLVAVPSHIIVRNRNNCCAPFGTFWGIATGLAIMLLCFGPGVFFLFAERFRRLKAARNR